MKCNKDAAILLKNPKPLTFSADYGTIRDRLAKDCGHTLNLNNVGTVFADVIDCTNTVMFFGVKREGNNVNYDSVFDSANAIADHEYNDDISDAEGKYILSVLATITLSTISVLFFTNVFGR